MAKIEIDPKLFVTCRLCLDNLGVYQIVPSIQQQIKFCYDIEVDPFDCLPQLICRNCESELSKYFEMKKKYVDKQRTLREGKIVNTTIEQEQRVNTREEEQEHDTVSSTQQLTSDEKDNKVDNVSTFYDASSDKSAETEHSSTIKVKSKKLYKRIKRIPESWEIGYDKSFICRFCDKCCKTKREIVKHITTHSSLLSTYRKFIQKDCSVTLNKTDNKPNLCNSDQIVVHDCARFLNSKDNFYYTLYQPKSLGACSDLETSPIEIGSLSSMDNSGTESNDSEPVHAQNKRKRRRLISRSSNETIVVENKNVSANLDIKSTSEADITLGLSHALEVNNDECINIDDSSDTASCKSSTNTKNNSEPNKLMLSKQDDLKTIQKFISVCFNKYYAKLKSVESDKAKNSNRHIDSSLKHKVLSFGRKIINSPGVSCVGILRYLEHQNLEIVWIPRLSNSNKKPDPVQVMIKLKNPVENESRDNGWMVLHDHDTHTDIINDKTQTENLTTPSLANVITSSEERDEGSKVVEAELEPAVLLPYTTPSEKDTFLKKLLNHSPVLNPKQLPKKASASEFQAVGPTKKITMREKILQPDLQDLSKAATSDDILLMPKIISTRSLARPRILGHSKKQDNVDNDNIDVMSPSASISNQNTHMIDPKTSNDTEIVNENTEQGLIKNPPWIKVKPVSELMSNRALNSINNSLLQQNNITINQNQISNVPYQKVCVPNNSVPMLHNGIGTPSEMQQSVGLQISTEKDNLSLPGNLQQEYVLMDSVDLPCTKTDSPFRYLKNLLQIHNVTLLDTTEKISRDFISLLKFKLQFEQENNLPVTLSLQLLNSQRRFCLKVRDANHKDIDITRLSANWQWEILKIYTGDMVKNQLLHNARSHSVYDYTNLFLCVLKGIKFQKLS